MTTKNGQVVVQAESQWEAATAPEKVARLQERERETREAAEDLLQVTLFPSPAAIAREMQNRSQYLRTRPQRSGQLGRWEKEILAELDSWRRRRARWTCSGR